MANAATRMCINSGNPVGKSATESFMALEMRVEYLETQCEDAQAALARKHILLQKAQNKLSTKEKEVAVVQAQLNDAQRNLKRVQ